MSAPYDVVVVGAGPAGATTAYYLIEYAKKNLFGYESSTPLRVALLDKETFPRDKYCGDAWCAPALDILEDMNVLQKLEAQGLVCNTLAGGFVSPSGYSFVANDRPIPGVVDDSPKNMATRAYSIKRKICDEAIARRAAEVGAELVESALVESTTFDHTTKLWAVRCADGRTFQSRLLIASDGAASNVARKLGIVQTAPNATAARQYVKGGTHNFKADGILLYPEYTLPGYMALFRHYDDSIDLGAYFLPGGAASDEDIQDIYENKIRTDPFISRALGPKWEPLERVKVASLRLGGVDQSYGDAFLIVGDAAGQVDPLTGEGIHTAMIAGKIAAQTALEMFSKNDLSQAAAKIYHDRWWKSFGTDFPLSSRAGQAVYKLPFLMDAVPIAAAAKGTGKSATSFFADFGAVMTGVKPKSTFLLPWVAGPLAVATMGVLFRRYVTRSERGYYDEHLFEQERARITSFEAQCLIDPTVPVGKAATPQEILEKTIQQMFAWGTEHHEKLPPVLVAFGTEYGFSQEVGKKVCEALAATGKCTPRLVDLAHLGELVDVERERLLICVCSTAGDGEFPVEARKFRDWMETTSPSFRKLRFAVLAPGDSAYPSFCAAGRKVAQLLTKAGGTPLLETRDLDGDRPDLADAWTQEVVGLVDDLLTRESAALYAGLVSTTAQVDYLYEAAKKSGELLISLPRATKSNPFVAKLKAKKLLTNPKVVPEDKWHVVVDVAKAGDLLAYEPGDALGVLPVNAPEEVRALGTLLGLNTALWPLLEEKNLKDLSAKAAEMLGILSLSSQAAKDNRWIVDLVAVAPATCPARANPEAFVRALRSLEPRFYSIASSPVMDAGEIHLCVAAVRYEADAPLPGSTTKRALGGVASTWMADRLRVGDKLRVFVQRNPDFRLMGCGTETPGPKVMIGPGTGLAPFRAFYRHEAAVGVKPSDSALYFGCRKRLGDFVYGDEMEKSLPAGWKLHTAFSRDQAEKVYVQHRIRENATDVWRVLSHPRGAVYVCGDGWSMAKDVQDALVEVCVSRGGLQDRAAATEFVKSKTHLDVWTV